MSFKQVQSLMDFPAMERELLDFWYKEGIVEKYLNRNKESDKKFSFLDGPITANNPMGVHHAWGRTYKDVWQRWNNMRGLAGRFQNGFDEQGLWVEVEVEKELGLKNKKDILNLVPGDEHASLEKFVNLCKERVAKYSAVQTDQSKRLGYFMDWDNSYHTSSDTNNYTIWNYLKTVYENGWIYKGHDSVPWCPRCGTAISQHEILTEDYKEVTHDSIYFKLPLVGVKDEYLLVWTTTPWTLPANIAVAVNEKFEYALVEDETGDKFWLLQDLVETVFKDSVKKIIKTSLGKDLVGLKYSWAFDNLPKVKEIKDEFPDKFHLVIATDDLIMPISKDEGTGMVHTAVSAGEEDFQLGKKLGLPMIEVIDEEASYLEGLGDFSGQNAKKDPKVILDYLTEADKNGSHWVFKILPITHRYPACWRCKTELVWRVVDEWYINMDGKKDGSTYRQMIMGVTKKINWSPKWALERELDWLKNMHDWLISKKRFWGLALPIWECKKCGNFDVIGGYDELKDRATEGWSEFEGHSPHRPWIDQVKISCSKCSETISRIPDVGNPWLDAGIVPFSTLPEDWFPANFITEGFPGQFKNWFYSLLTMSTALKNTNPFENILGFANVVDEKGEEMHKSKGNSVEFNAAADQAGVDPMRWLYVTQNPEQNLKFGFNVISDIRRRFYLILWNSYKFFVDYANVANWSCELETGEHQILDKWILARLTEVIKLTNTSLEKYDASTGTRAIEDFVVNDFSTWYIRRSRDRVGQNASEKDRNVALGVMYGVLVGLSKILAPFMPFISEEMYRNLTSDVSVHLTDYPTGDESLLDKQLIADMKVVRQIVELGHSKRKEENVKLRQPLAKVEYGKPFSKLSKELESIIAEELNVKSVEFNDGVKNIILDLQLTDSLKAEGEARELIRQIQQLRKDTGLTLQDKIEIVLPGWPKDFEAMILKMTGAVSISEGESSKINKLD